MASLLVIGGTGFFGKSILDSYRRGLLTSWGIDRIEVVARKARNLSILNPELISANVFLHDLDITSCNHLPYADYVIHAAASTDASDYVSNPEGEQKNIQLGTTNFCNLVPKYLANSQILYVSSGAAYGKQSAMMSHIDEGYSPQTLKNLEPGKIAYAESKRISERYIKGLGDKGFDVAIARCFSFVGPYLPRDQHFAIGNFIENGLKGNSIVVKANHPVYRSYLYADDLVSWLIIILKSAAPSCPVVNVGSDQEILITDLATMVASYFRVNVCCPKQSDTAIDRYVPRIDKAISMGCTRPKSISDSIEATVKTIKNLSQVHLG